MNATLSSVADRIIRLVDSTGIPRTDGRFLPKCYDTCLSRMTPADAAKVYGEIEAAWHSGALAILPVYADEPCGPPNLDGMDHTELQEAESVFVRLAAYCNHRRCSMRARLAGNIAVALDLERVADDIYSKLPTWAKW